MPIVYTRTAGSYTHSTGTAEQTVLTLTPVANNIVKGIWFDFTNLTQTCTIRIKYQIDGTNFRTFQTSTWIVADEDGVLIDGDIPVAVSKGLRVTFQSGTTEGVSRSIPYEIWSEGLGAGAIAWVYTLTNSISSVPIAGAEIWITSDSSGNAVIASGLTDSSGQVTFYLDAGTVWVWTQHPDFSFSNPDQETVS